MKNRQIQKLAYLISQYGRVEKYVIMHAEAKTLGYYSFMISTLYLEFNVRRLQLLTIFVHLCFPQNIIRHTGV